MQVSAFTRKYFQDGFGGSKDPSPVSLSILTPPNGVTALNLTRAKKLTILPSRELMSLLIENGILFN
jgi:hypothetical protein